MAGSSSRSSAAVLADQVKSLDWVQRRATFKSQVPKAVLSAVKAKIHALIGFRPAKG